MTKTILKLVQGSDEWINHRILHRNASETAAAMGLSPWLSQFQLWEIKTGRRRQVMTYPMQRGIEMEPLAREAYENQTGAIMEPQVIVDGEYSCSLDGITYDSELILEVKCPMKGQASDTWKTAATGLVEHHYHLQVQHQLMVSGASLAHFYVFDGRKGIIVEVEPNKDTFHDIREAWDRFMEFVVKDVPPPLTAMDTVTREDEEWRLAANRYLEKKKAAEDALTCCEEAKSELVAMAHHSSERGCGVAVCRFWKGRKNSKEEVRVTATKQGGEPC